MKFAQMLKDKIITMSDDADGIIYFNFESDYIVQYNGSNILQVEYHNDDNMYIVVMLADSLNCIGNDIGTVEFDVFKKI